jgi:predicted ATPase
LINSALTTGGVAIVDDLDSSLHPIILAEILSWFHRPERNPQNAQFWISCHNVSLLESLIKEEVFFCEKDKAGQTHLFGLKNIPAVRRDDNYYKKYLDGFYGAVPQIG